MLLGLLTLEDGTDVVPKRRLGITTTSCVIAQKTAVLTKKKIYKHSEEAQEAKIL
jgi:hypothetical protein